MPKDVIYPFALASYGNVAMCEAQGLIYIIGNGICFAMNDILNIYYLCSLRFNMKEKTVRNYLEIPLYILALALNIGIICGTLMDKHLDFCSFKAFQSCCTFFGAPTC